MTEIKNLTLVDLVISDTTVLGQFGNDVSSGVYIYQLNFGEGLITKKMILIR